MKNITNRTIFRLLVLINVFGVLGMLPQRAEAQTSTYSTVTTTAVNAGQLCFVLASTTNMQASGALSGPGGTPQEWDLWFDGEFAKINTVNTTSNQVCVMRGKSPTRAGTHPTASLVFYGPAGAVPFIVSAPSPPVPGPADNRGGFGSCVSTQYQFLPLINVADGSIWNCLTTARGARWVAYSFRLWASGHPVTTIIDAAYTASLADEFIIYPSLTTVRIVTLPAITGVLGKTMVISAQGAAGTLTVTPVNAQTIGNGGAATVTVGSGNVIRLISALSATSTWIWETW